jgi:hypothetical protein
MTAMATAKRRLATLEAASDDGGDGCPQCRGFMIVVRDAVTDEPRRASWNGEPLSAEEFAERETERRCPRCGRDMSGDENPVITIGGRRRSL